MIQWIKIIQQTKMIQNWKIVITQYHILEPTWYSYSYVVTLTVDKWMQIHLTCYKLSFR